ncbi:hypothetical protein V9T40_001526 [Parthenolecanium corni]|uniref:Uncharacterized protein n=1 Tax=Parthenolecanium corni TaxID=536013 RepID=A0AAN9Y4N8_9HEMI
MSLHDQDDLMPRPLPKPSQVEILSIHPEVPEPSLIIDKFYSQKKPNNYVLNSFKSSSISDSSPSRNGFTQNYDSIQQKSAESSNSTSSYSPAALPNQVDLHNNCRKVSFSSPSNHPDQRKSINQYHNTNDSCKNSFQPESCSCQFNNHELESDLRSEQKLHSPSVCTDFARNVHRMPDYEYPMQNEMCSRKRCSCTACMKEYFDGLASKEQKQNYISSEELQKAVLKFENLFLKLNYKYSKITENFVSKDELIAVIRSHEAKIDSMQAVIDAMVSKNKMNHCNHCSQSNPHYQSQEPAINPVTTKSNSPIRAEKLELLRNNDCHQNLILESKSHPNDGFDAVKYDRKREDFRPSHEPQIYQTRAIESQKCHTNAFEEQRKHSHSPSDRFLSSRRNNYHEELEKRDHISATRLKDSCNPQDHGRWVAAENESKCVESNGHFEQEKETIMRNLKDDQQLKFLYNNIITQVKNMLEKNIPVGVYGKTDPMQFVKEATVEQFEKLGLNVKNIVDEDKERNLPRVQSCDNEEARRMPIPKTNLIPSSDVSLHMNALAMKYISNYQKDENDFTEKKSAMNDLSMNCNNVSIATLRYLERHQILSELG